jgi:hypothetical protein
MYRVGFPGMTACKACAAFQTTVASWQKFPPNNFDARKNKKKISLSGGGRSDLWHYNISPCSRLLHIKVILDEMFR